MVESFVLETVSVAFTTAEGIRPVLIDVDLQIGQGEWVAVIGRNGSGKSTLAKVLAGLCPISRGAVRHAAAQRLGAVQMVFQNPEAQIVGETVYEDVCFGLENVGVDPAEMPARVQHALQQVGLLHKMHDSVQSLSGGQKQLLGIAGCLAMQAQTLVFDEATAMLDPASRQHILQVVQELHRQGRTILWITQWMEEVAYANRVIALEAGKVAYDGGNRAFFYASEDEETSPCEQLGFALPYAVQVATALRALGVSLWQQPILPDELSEAVGDVCRS